jgi:tetratricopeptide (TPR) repeat protein
MTGAVAEVLRPVTTSGPIALVNLSAQIDSVAARAPGTAELIDLLTLRGHVLARIADYERAAGLAAALVRDAPDGTAFLARARTAATFHRFADALADLDAAGYRRADRASVDTERATVVAALGRHEQAIELSVGLVRRQPDFATLGALAVLRAELGEVTDAERLFTRARHAHRGISPFPLASLDLRRGLMWYRAGDLPAARAWLEASRRRMPAYAPALGRLAEIDTILGDHQSAIARLQPVACSSDDPGYAAQLARALKATGQHEEAARYYAYAAERYDQLASRFPQAFAGHAADFRSSG